MQNACGEPKEHDCDVTALKDKGVWRTGWVTLEEIKGAEVRGVKGAKRKPNVSHTHLLSGEPLLRHCHFCSSLRSSPPQGGRLNEVIKVCFRCKGARAVGCRVCYGEGEVYRDAPT